MRHVPIALAIRGAMAFTALALAACSDPGAGRVLGPKSPLRAATSSLNRTAETEKLEVCKDYAEGSVPPALTGFTVGAAATGSTFQLAPGECKEVWLNGGGNPVDNVTVTETVPAGFTASYVVTTIVQGGQPQPGGPTSGNTTTVPIGGPGVPGALVVFTNTPIPVPPSLQGRMTGGGFTAGNVKVTGGFTVHCDITLSNNLEINWGKNKWHLDKPITSAICIDDPNIEPKPPVAPFDTFIGEGIGELNGVGGSLVKFTFIDAGEPGRNDMVKLQIFPPGGGAPVLDLPLSKLAIGNLQAHYDQPHGQKP